MAGGQTVTPKAITITAASNTKTYDSTTTAGATPVVSGGLVGSDTVTGLSETYTTASAGSNKTETVSSGYTVNDGNAGKNYTVTTANDTTGVINKATLTITASTNTKTYDSTTTAAATPTVSGLVGGDTVTGLSETYATATAGTGKTLNVSSGYTVNDGNSGGNYTVTTAANTTGVINKAALTITASTNTKTYDSTTTAAATPTVSGLVGGDTVTGLSETYATATAGSGKTLNVSSGYTVNDGNSGGNYTVTTAANTTGVINKAALTITAATNTKNYDSTTTAAATPTVSGLVGGDTVTGLGEAYATATAGTGKTLNVKAGYTVNDGNSGGNYTVTTVANTTGVINKAALTITAATNTKTYDGTTTAAATPVASGLVGGDTVTGLTEAYNNKNTGTGKTLSVSGYTVNDGNGGNNYTVTTTSNTTGAINKAALTITAVTYTKTFDGNTSAAGAVPTVAGLVGGDTVTGAAEQFANAGPGTNIPLSVSAYTVNDGNGGNNYTVTTTPNNTGAIIAQSSGVSITNTTGSMLEPPLGAKATYTFTISLDQPLPNDVYANYSTVNGTGPTGAKAGRDFLGVTNVTVKIPAGSTSVPVSVTVLGDAPEPVGGPTDAFFTVVLNWSVDSKNGNQVVNTSSATADIKETFAPRSRCPPPRWCTCRAARMGYRSTWPAVIRRPRTHRQQVTWW